MERSHGAFSARDDQISRKCVGQSEIMIMLQGPAEQHVDEQLGSRGDLWQWCITRNVE